MVSLTVALPRLLAAILLAGLPQTAQACQLEPRAAVALSEAGGLSLVTVLVNGTPASFVLDTGAQRSVIGVEAADRLHLARDAWVSTDVEGLGGRDRRRLGRPESLSLGGITLRRHTVASDNSLVVGPLPVRAGGQPIDGLLGQDYLSAFDVDLDVPSRRMTLYAASACSGRFLPWRTPYDAVAAWRPAGNILAVPLRIGGTVLQAELDTGAAISVITLPGLLALGIAPGTETELEGFGAGRMPASVRHFPAVQVGDLPPAATDLAVAPLHSLRSIGALLGADWIATRHVWISWSSARLFVARSE